MKKMRSEIEELNILWELYVGGNKSFIGKVWGNESLGERKFGGTKVWENESLERNFAFSGMNTARTQKNDIMYEAAFLNVVF